MSNTPLMELTDAIVVNGFIFCGPHGGEWCNACNMDHRDHNNGRVDRAKVMAGAMKGFDFDVRLSISQQLDICRLT